MSELRTKTLALRIKAAAGTPSDDQLAAIRPYTLREHTAEELVVREYTLAHNAIDRDKDCFSPELLVDFQRTLVGKGVYIKHPRSWDGDSGPAEGRIFGSSIVRMSHDDARKELREPGLVWPPDQLDAVLLRVAAYYVRTPDNTAFLLKLDAGIAGDVSVGFHAKGPERLRDAEGRELNAWRLTSPGEGLEMSHVWLGAQPGARAIKDFRNKEPDMDKLDELNAQIKTLQTERDQQKAIAEAGAKATAAFDALRKALGDAAPLLDDPARLAAAIADGQTHRKALVDDIVAAERQLGITGDDDKSVDASKALYAALPTEKLQVLAKSFEARAPRGPGAVAGGDPNAGKPGAGGSTVPDALDF